MIDRLAMVLGRYTAFTPASIETIRSVMALIAQVGPAGLSPLLILGGTGLALLRDIEDRHVMEVACAARARIIATANFADFIAYRTRVVEPGRIAVHQRADHEVIIAHPFVAAEWFRAGRIVLG